MLEATLAQQVPLGVPVREVRIARPVLLQDLVIPLHRCLSVRRESPRRSMNPSAHSAS